MNLCVAQPSLDIIAKGVMVLDLEYEMKEDMSYPKDSRSKHGCVKVEKGKMTKTELLPKLGKILVENQGR